MCISIPAKVLVVNEAVAEVEVAGVRKPVLLAGQKVNEGDWVLINGAVLLTVVPEPVALETLQLLNEMRPAQS